MDTRIRALRLGTAALLLIATVLHLSPGGLATGLWVGPQATVMGARSGSPSFVAAGLAIMAAVVLPLALLATAIGLARGRRRSAVTAAVLLGVLAATVLGPGWTAVVTPWAPRFAVLAVDLLAFGLAVAIAITSDGDQRPSWVARSFVLVVAAVLLVAMVVGVFATGIPATPTWPRSGGSFEASTSGPLIDSPPSAHNPALATGQGPLLHNDSWMTDAYTGRELQTSPRSEVRSFFAGADCASLLWDDRGRIVAVCVSPTDVNAYILDPVTLAVISSRHLGSRRLTARALTDFSGGGYAALDAQQRLVVPQQDGVISRYDATADLAPVDSFPVTAHLQPGEQVTSVVPAWPSALKAAGTARPVLLWFVGQRGTVGLLDTATGAVRTLLLRSADGGEVDIENSFAVVQDGAIVVTSAALVKLSIASDGSPVIAWSTPYDSGQQRKPGQTSRASGTTPTVFAGGDLVAITDNAEPTMRVLVADPRTGAVACTVPVFGAGESATENSLIAMGTALYVENNFGYALLDVANGRTTTPGFARVDARPCRLGWTSEAVSAPSVVAKGVVDSAWVLTYTKPYCADGLDEWWFTALDARTGEVAWMRRAGTGPLYNNHYAGAYVGPNGGVYVGTVSGVVALVP